MHFLFKDSTHLLNVVQFSQYILQQHAFFIKIYNLLINDNLSFNEHYISEFIEGDKLLSVIINDK